MLPAEVGPMRHTRPLHQLRKAARNVAGVDDHLLARGQLGQSMVTDHVALNLVTMVNVLLGGCLGMGHRRALRFRRPLVACRPAYRLLIGPFVALSRGPIPCGRTFGRALCNAWQVIGQPERLAGLR